MDTKILGNYGIDYDKGMARCMNDQEFYERVMAMFLEDDSFYRAQKAWNDRNYRELFKCTHELKGACGNAALIDLYDAVCPLVDLLRNEEETEAEVQALVSRMEAVYDRTREGVTLALSR